MRCMVEGAALLSGRPSSPQIGVSRWKRERS